MVKESDVKGEGGLRVDWGVRGFWEHQREALFDCHIFNADAISYLNTSIDTLLEKHRNEKKYSTTKQLKIEDVLSHLL